MLHLRASLMLFAVGGVLLLMSPLILSREGTLMFAGAGAVLIVVGLFPKHRERHER
jgi:hypothetical protein